MRLPLPIQTFFDADQGGASAQLSEAFLPEASVTDEGHTHTGLAAIAAWWHATKAEYRHTATPLRVEENDGITKVEARVAGDFPGSPAMLTFAFALQGDRIARLEIDA